MSSDIFEDLRFTSKGKVVKRGDKYNAYIELHIEPTDDVLTAEGPVYPDAKNAAISLAKIYGQRLQDLIKEYEP